MEKERMEKLKQKAEKEQVEKEKSEKKMERERMEKLKQKAEKEQAEKEKSEKIVNVRYRFQSTLLEVIDRERCSLMSLVANGVLKLVIQARYKGILVGGAYEATGFIISNCGYFTTNLHVVSERCLTTGGTAKFLQADVTVSHIGNQEVCLPAKIIIAHSGVDLAICKFDIPRGVSVHVFDFCYSEPEVGQQVMTVGNPPGCPNTSRYGAVANVGFSLKHFPAETLARINIASQFVPYDFAYLLFDLNGASGFSGGPSFNVKGRVLAINHATSRGDWGYYNLAVPVKHLWRLIVLHVKTGKSGYLNDDGMLNNDGSDEDGEFVAGQESSEDQC